MSKKEISYQQLIAAALIKFKQIDFVDLHLLVKEYSKIGTINHHYLDDFSFHVKYRINGEITIPNKKSLTDKAEDVEKTYYEIYKEYATDSVLKFVDSIDSKKFQANKRKILDEYKERMLKSSNILLISDIREDYTGLINYGFNNIDYFKSIVRADKYFKEHPEELEKYHIILIGNQNVLRCDFQKKLNLQKTIDNLEKTKQIIFSNIFRYSDHITMYLKDMAFNRDFQANDKETYKTLDKLIQCGYINDILNTQTKGYTPIIESENYLLNPFPEKLSDLKIEFLKTLSQKDLSDNLGLNIDYHRDSNYGLGTHVKDKLGDFDIIIVSDSFSHNILGMNRESTEQCKDTKRPVTLLVTYKIDNLRNCNENNNYIQIGNKITLNYTFGGEFSPSYKIYSIEYYLKNNDDEEIIKSIIKSCIHIYKSNITYNKFEEIPYPTPEDYTEEYSKFFTEFENNVNKQLYPIRLFDKLLGAARSYLNNPDIYTLNDLTITEEDNTIIIHSFYNEQVVCSIKFPKHNTHDGLRLLTIQTTNNKGNLGKEEAVGLYTNKYECVENIPKKATDKQVSVIEAIEKKLKHVLANPTQNTEKKYVRRKKLD